jgi:hypothetical protein
MAISLELVDTVYQWVKGAQDNLPVYVAQDDATDEDVLSSGTLVGLSCLDSFELQTGYYETGKTYTAGVGLTAFKTGETLAGYFTPLADVGGLVAGLVTRINGVKDLLVADAVRNAPEESAVDDGKVIIFATAYTKGTAETA